MRPGGKWGGTPPDKPERRDEIQAVHNGDALDALDMICRQHQMTLKVAYTGQHLALRVSRPHAPDIGVAFVSGGESAAAEELLKRVKVVLGA